MFSKIFEFYILICISDNINIIICRLLMLRFFICNRKNLIFFFKFIIFNEYNMRVYL